MSVTRDFHSRTPVLDESRNKSVDFHLAGTYVVQAGFVEVVSAALIILGALGPIGPKMWLADMVVAAVATTTRDKHFDFDQREEEALFAGIAIVLALSGFGAISVHSALDIHVFDRGGLSVLAYFRELPFVRLWNGSARPLDNCKWNRFPLR